MRSKTSSTSRTIWKYLKTIINKPSINTESRISSIIAALISSGISTPIAIEKRNTPFSITRKPTIWVKIRERSTMSIKPVSSAYKATPKKIILIVWSAT